MDDRLEVAADWQTLEQVRRFARIVQALPGWELGDLPDLFRGQAVVATTALPPDLFGFIVCAGADRDRRWKIQLNERLPVAAARATLGHEFGHMFQPAGLAQANCVPRAGLPVTEQEAHAIGALLTVPFTTVAGLTLSDGDGRLAVAAHLSIPVSYVEIRGALAVFLGERRGDRYEASAHLNWAMLAHQRWMAGIADLLRERRD